MFLINFLLVRTDSNTLNASLMTSAIIIIIIIIILKTKLRPVRR